MFSRAHLLIEREYEKLCEAPPWGIEARPLKDDNIFEWAAKIKGLKSTLWQGGIFRVYVKFDENFSQKPPEICFHTIPFHPNVDMITGRPCIDFLDDHSKWKESYSLSFILVTIQNLLSNPNLMKPVNSEAAEMIIHSPHAYKQMVLDCVSSSQRVDAGVTSHHDMESRVRFTTPEKLPSRQPTQRTAGARISRLSFDDYHNTWCGIATSKSTPDMKNPLLESIKDQPLLQKAHLGLPQEEIEEQMKRQIEEHDDLMYGKFTDKPVAEDEKAAKMAKLNRMRKIYLPPRISPTPSAVPPPSTGKRDEPLDEEVEDLLAWSSKLDADTVDT
ncbi:ubiquitin-conjugating enzyme E2 U-like [Mizuhopecten yessoensis]|uniref:Ubiquitin-conjugating enzyme E2 U n=1 Tax=Mizuhopecten yessoensis TaxID=6573 RepID=A0A210PMF1_MIZYE|nr:ubiquitin-conjugating enzyme E2 U-like [Mizuhopecten yessoensis]OWF37680.1 Ubiquitin-conjugating enzyme E2 U [Mizuhopecten yessoensis]